jgi:hypothetical protein
VPGLLFGQGIVRLVSGIRVGAEPLEEGFCPVLVLDDKGLLVHGVFEELFFRVLGREPAELFLYPVERLERGVDGVAASSASFRAPNFF